MKQKSFTSLEQKAKAYDEAIKRAKSAIKECGNNQGRIAMIESIFPELKESEDEKIRKALIRFHKSTIDIDGIKGDEIVAWLEKQEGCEHIKKDWLEHIKQSWYKEGFIDGKYSDKTLVEWTVNDATTLNELIDFLENGTAKLQHDLTRYANWLKIKFTPIEKQSEQKPFDYENANIQQKDFAPKVELKFKKGDWIISNNKQSTYQVIEVKRGIYVIRDNADNHEFYIGIEECEKSGRLFTIQDAKDGDVLYSPCLELLWIFKNRDSVYCGCNLSYNNGAFCGEGYFEMPTDAIPATKEQHDTLMKAMTDAGWEFDFDKKELKKISQRMVSAEAKEAMYDKPTDEEMKELLRTEYEKGRADAIAEMQKGWSEEDERNLRLTEYAVMKFFGGDCSLVGWLRKSLKERYTWKPSDGQLECLGYAIEKAEKDWSPLTNNRIYLTLKALKEQLLELRGSKV